MSLRNGYDLTADPTSASLVSVRDYCACDDDQTDRDGLFWDEDAYFEYNSDWVCDEDAYFEYDSD